MRCGYRCPVRWEVLASTVADTRTDSQETVLTGNLVMALFNHDTSRTRSRSCITHAVVVNGHAA